MVTQNSANNKTGASGKVLQSQGVGTASDFSTATYPATATSTGTILRADGTNWVATTATYPTTTTISEILYSSSTSVVGGLATVNNGVLIASNAGVPSILAGGTVDYVLTANTGAPPSWQRSRGYVISLQIPSGNPADSTSYYLSNAFGLTVNTTAVASARYYIPVAGTITKVYGTLTNGGTLGSNTNCTINVRLNDTTNTAVTTTVKTNTTNNPFNNTALSIAVAAGDYISLVFVTPAWPTNPTSVGASASIYIQ